MDPFGPEDTPTSDARRSSTKGTESSPKQAHPAGAGNVMAREGGNTGKAPPAPVDRRPDSATPMTQAGANARRPPAIATMSDAPGFSGGEGLEDRRGMFSS